ncbi:MAG: diaminopimelate decarboxylase [Deltaproteobacteria bacterium]|nr:diaminopimelate decarboxylase [Deltaproteobacteria bacterium]
MHSFLRRGKDLFCEGAPLGEIAARFGTPLYVYSEATLARHTRVFDEAFAGTEHLVCFAVKANPSLALLDLLARHGAGADIVSGGELARALAAGVPGERIVYSGVGKTVAEMERALDAGILMFNIESFEELEALDAVAGRMGCKAPISLRVNPDVDPGTHAYVATGLKTSKFGIPFASAIAGYERAGALRHIEVVGVDCHVGSQITEVAPFVDAVSKIGELVACLRGRGFGIRYLDVGGGLGITYDDERPPSPAEYGRAVRDAMGVTGLTLVLEPGRNLIGNAGVLLTRVLYVKESGDKRFVIVDAGMNDLLRPSLYDAYHAVVPVRDEGRAPFVADVVGPICESGDFFAKDRELPEVGQGDLLAVMSAGAYGFSMASTYNSRPLAAEVLVRGERAALIRERGTYADLTRGERLPEFS